MSERISRVLEQSHLRPTSKQILKILMPTKKERGFNKEKLEKACARIIRLQVLYRGFSQERKYKQARARLIRLQTVYRGFSQRQKYKQARARLISLTAIV